MFRFFRRESSPYAVAIRDSMKQTPERWTLTNGGSYLERNGISVWVKHAMMWCPLMDWETLPDRRCIREGIEAWIAWSVQKREVCDE